MLKERDKARVGMREKQVLCLSLVLSGSAREAPLPWGAAPIMALSCLNGQAMCSLSVL